MPLTAAGLPVVRSITPLIVTVSPSLSPLADVPAGKLIMIGLPLVLVMLEIELPTMVPGYPLKLTPKTPVRPLPLMVMTAPGSRSRGAGDIGGHGGAVEDREGERVRGVVGRRRPVRRSL